ncbi:MAG: CDP-glycerol glycerophosphotransferase family protein [Bacteroidales bacterium]|nr:CDP-glycerol glycerophosphotransferase family protein [Bacteroidales bacterium]
MIEKITKNLKNILTGFLYNGIKVIYKWLKLLSKPLYNIYFNIKLKKVQANHKKALEIVCKKEKIKVAFFLIHESVWKYNGLYRIMEADEGFEPIVVVCPFIKDGEEQMLRDLDKAFDLCIEKGYNVVSTLNKETNTWLDINKEIKPDIIFFTNPRQLTKPEYYITNFSDSVLTCYSPYAPGICNLPFSQYNQIFHNLLWRFFVETDVNLQMSKKYADNKGVNTIVTGSPAFDHAFGISKSTFVKRSTRKKIIWAPHHTIDNRENLWLSNFIEISGTMVDLAIKYASNVDFVFKPHPLLKSKLYKLDNWGKLKTDEYYIKWDNMPNTSVQLGDYIKLFDESDAMILDSVSFIVEYMITRKPILFTMRNKDVYALFNDLGQKMLESLEHSYTLNDIDQFIINVIENNSFQKQIKREDLVDNFIKPPFNKSASENIFNYLVTTLNK